ncbi:MAG: RNA polymerase sigma factor [Myxococcaceae bacterium]
MTDLHVQMAEARERFLEAVAELRPELHRYCSRLTGSAIDGEDVVQDALAKAFYSLALQPEPPALRPWLLRIAHNCAIDFLRRYERRAVEPMAELPEPQTPTKRSAPTWCARRSRASPRCRCSRAAR